MKLLPFITAITASLLFSACAADTNTSPTPSSTAAPPVKTGPMVATMSTTPIVMTSNQPLATSTNDMSPMPTPVASSGQLGGQLASGMDSMDRSHLSHGLDGPVGRATQWISTRSGVQYTLIPTQKFTMNGNSFCRQYTLTATRGTQSHTISGSACVDQNSNWESVA